MSCLIAIYKDSLVVAPSEILIAWRNGNYTEITLKGSGNVESVWDEDKRLWNAIMRHVDRLCGCEEE